MKSYPKSIRLDYNLHEMWQYLRSLRVNPAAIFVAAGREALMKKCEEMKRPESKLPY